MLAVGVAPARLPTSCQEPLLSLSEDLLPASLERLPEALSQPVSPLISYLQDSYDGISIK